MQANNTTPILPFRSPKTADPANIDAEYDIIGAILVDPGAIARIAHKLPPEAFYVHNHRTIYQACLELHRDGQIVDLMTVCTALANNKQLDKVGGKSAIAQMFDLCLTSANVEQHADLILEKHFRRCMARAGAEIQEISKDVSRGLGDCLSEAQRSLGRLLELGVSESSVIKLDQVVALNICKTEDAADDKIPKGIPTGFYDLDEMLRGVKPGELIILAGRPSMGKCLGKGTRVVMFDGTLKAVENVAVGDLLMGPDSKPRKVLSLARGREMMYWVRQKRAIDYRVNESHILSLKYSGDNGTIKHGDIFNVSVRGYLDKSQRFKERAKGYKVAVDWPDQPLKIDPYLLGVWLGDGSTGKGSIHNPDPEIENFLRDYSSKTGCEYRCYDRESCPEHVLINASNAKGLWTLLGELGLQGDKRIPDSYVANSIDKRMNLLAGLLDTDGYYCSKFNCFEITLKSKILSEQVKYLADTLGFRTSLNSKQGTIKEVNFSGTYYRVRISGDLDSIPTKVERKQARALKTKRDWRNTGVSVEKDCVDDYYGFEIDGDHLFLLEDLTVTHNTAGLVNVAVNVAAQGRGVYISSLEMSAEQLGYRIMSADSSIESGRLRDGKVGQHEWPSLGESVTKLAGLPVWIDDSFRQTPETVAANIQRINAENGPGTINLAMVDYIQLMGDRGAGNRVAELGKISRGFKGMAKELGLSVWTLSQLSRGVESRNPKRPLMSDLRESGNIEEDADAVILLYREDYYDPDTPDRGLAEWIVGKNRNGPTGTVKLLFEPAFTRFRNLAPRIG
ncbi:replicative dna helicase [Leptolyngbya sp. Heron Island J]|uniref:replicative DNA helicase n=1 Tax=Leptolyngbya sp. Heron Island J TaxID=1385935 RepID=UPI0003B9770C|nr:replicative DNA helicase [Leptolyngbya sp. Heron Island J]ESA38423.1 replicative dna helicase [Leptolyngbya sp. Heron Island J]